MSDGIDLRFRRSNQTFGTSLSFENDILSLLNNRGDILSSVNIDLIKKEELPTANEDNLGVIYLYTGPDDEYKHGYFYECVENSGVYSWENIVVQDSYLKSETYNKTETDTELAKKLNTDGSNTFTGVLKMRASISFKGAVAPSWSGIGIYELNDNDSVSLMASMEKIDGFTPASNNTYNIGVNSRKWKDLYLAGKAYIPTINNGADISVPTVAGTMARVEDIENKISNCITEIPQDIKLELNNGTVTLKTGSKTYDGNGLFAEVQTDSSLPNAGYNGQVVVIYTSTNVLATAFMGDSVASLPSPSSSYKVYYNTTDKKCYLDTGSWIEVSFPIALATSTITEFTSIDQVFNGSGRVGSTIFALPGVKGLIPDGRNEDGSLKSIEITVENVLTSQVSGTVDGHLLLNASGFYVSNNTFNYNIKENFNYQNNNKLAYLDVGLISISSGVITNFKFKNVFKALDYNDTSYIGSQSFPSKNIGLTLGASDTSYTAPTAGYIWFAKVATAAGQYIQLITPQMYNQVYANFVNQSLTIWSPIKKGETFNVRYNANGTTEHFEFIKAVGDV